MKSYLDGPNRQAKAVQTKTPGCQAVVHPHISPGWGCCQCRIYNNELRERCKQCGHARCEARTSRAP